MTPQQHLLYNGLVCLVDYPILHRNGLARTDSVVGYGHRGWSTASEAHPAGERCWHGAYNGTDRQRTDKVKI